MMKSLLFALLLIFSFSKNVAAQVVEERKIVEGINTNLFGNASIVSVNYERNYIVREKFTVAGSLGFGFNNEFRFCLGECSLPNKYLTIPHFITGNLSTNKNFDLISIYFQFQRRS